jgi:hypothetical protein
MTNALDKTVEELRAKLSVLLTVDEAAQIAHRSPSAIRRAMLAGALPYNQPAGAGGDIRLPRDAVLTWAFTLQVHKQSTVPAPPQPEKPRRGNQKPDVGPSRKRRAPLRAVPRGVRAWSQEEMLAFAASYS